jgi:FAD/FMN-containing dehydrogenase
VDNVFALDVVTGDGALIHCSGSEHRELFLTALGGQGQCAIIVRATLRVAAAPAMVRSFILPHASLPALMRDLATITDDERFDGAVGFALSRPDGQ